jgi:hypothetical protein
LSALEVTITRAPYALAIWIAAMDTPAPAACTSTTSPRATFALSTTICHAVMKVSGTAAASGAESLAGRGSTLTPGTSMKSA